MAVKNVDFVPTALDSMLRYGFSTVIGRAIPDLRDGLKPVHRRILYMCMEEGMRSTGAPRKSAKLVGSVLGRLHPHGDQSVYDAIVRLGQPWKMNVQLIDVQGNAGSIHGDRAAAMRYTEVRSSKVCEAMFRDVPKGTVPWTPNYDATEDEPCLLPMTFPNLLVNGTTGMAVGYATDVPPHNPSEAIDACILLIDDPEATLEDVMAVMPGPDFPTGGIVTNPSDLPGIYDAGRGVIHVRSHYTIEDRGRGASSLVFSDLPWGTSTARAIESMASLSRDKKLPGVTDVRDESGRGNYRLVVDVQNGASPEVVANVLFQNKVLETSVKVLMNGILKDAIGCTNLVGAIGIFLDFRREVVTKRAAFELRECLARQHIVRGLIMAVGNLDRVIAIVRSAPDRDAARELLVTEIGTTERQADAVLAMRLSQLTRLGVAELQQEDAQLTSRGDACVALLRNPQLVDARIKEELVAVKEGIGCARRTEILRADVRRGSGDDQLAAVTEEKDVVLTVSAQGYVKRVPLDAFAAQHRGGRGKKAMKARKDDRVERVVQCTSHDDLLVFTNTGRVFGCKAFRVPESAPDKVGSHAASFLSMKDGERAVEIIPVKEIREEDHVLICTRGNRIKKTASSEYSGVRNTGIIAIRIDPEDEILSATVVREDDEVLIGTSEGKALRFPEYHVRAMQRATMGVRAVDVSKDETIVNCTVIPKGVACHVVTVSSDGNGKKVPVEEFPRTSRDCKGVLAMSRREGVKMVYLGIAPDDRDLLVTTDAGVCIRLSLDEVNEYRRITKGSRVIRLDDGDNIASVAVVARMAEDR
jgi:DNA gyrase subunit A